MRIQDHFSISVNLDVGCGHRRVCMLLVGIGVCLSAARRFVSPSDTVVYILRCGNIKIGRAPKASF